MTVGRREGLPAALGTATGLYVHATLAAFGLSALVTRSSQAFAAVRLAGAAYLLILGISVWRTATPRPAEHPVLGRAPWARSSTYTQALLGNVLNPKAASIYLTLAPQFINPHQSPIQQIMILATAHAALIALWLLTWTLILGRAARAAASQRFKTVISKITATVLVALALRTAVT
ncbi:LysE family translocator [Actinacidiphila oryziradicis]|uniref:LysE family translocator n=1 Tax=Actinacidiphila oryziradicis TaxID=2571141 RepID=UPI001B80B2E8|nr:LysE family translocator [Actinacidiphila oryziradicis]